MDSKLSSWNGCHTSSAGKSAGSASLRALQAARADADARGEAAALKTLSACYQVLARPDDAAALSTH